MLLVKKGDVIPVPLGAVSWWFNGGDLETIIVFLGETILKPTCLASSPIFS